MAREELVDDALLERHMALIPNEPYSRLRMPEPQNVVCNCALGAPVNTYEILAKFPGSDFRLLRFPAVSVRLRPPPGLVARLFFNGKVTALGAAVPEEAELGLQNLRLALDERGMRYGMTPIFTSNMVASFHLPFCVRISEVNHEDEAGFTLMKDLFPGLIFRNLYPKVTLLIFETGSVMVLGARDISSMMAAVDKIHAILQPFAVPKDSPEAKEFRKGSSALRRNMRKRAAAGGAAAGAGAEADLTEAEQALLNQARIDDPEAFKRDLASNEMKRLAGEVKERRRLALQHAKHQVANTRAELDKMVTDFYNKLVERDRARREKRRDGGGGKSSAAKRRKKAPANEV